MAEQTSMFVKLILALLVIVLIIQMATGDLFGFVSHGIDKILTPEDKDGPADTTGQITGLVNLASFGSELAENLEPLLNETKEYCLHRIPKFEDSLFKDYSLAITNTGQGARIAIIDRSGTEISNKPLDKQITLCAIHKESAETLKDLIRNQNTDLSRLSNIELTNSLIFSSREKTFLSGKANVSLNLDSGEELRFLNLQFNEHIYFLKLKDTMCAVPVRQAIAFNWGELRCNTANGQLYFHCIDGRINNDLKRLYEQNVDIQCKS